MHRVRELSALTATAVAAAAARSVAEILRETLDQILRATDAPAGWVCLAAEESERLELVVRAGVPLACLEAEQPCDATGCVCREVMRSGRAAIVRDPASRCGRASAPVPGREGVACVASVPVVARDRVLGVLNIACEPSRRFSPEELTLLDSVGRHIGLAVENLRLWEDLRHREALRGQFLSQILVAQEAERKRVARELHDQVGQVLTALLVRLRRLEQARDAPPGFAEDVGELRDLVRQLFDDVHRIAVELQPGALDHLGLVGAIESVTAEFGRGRDSRRSSRPRGSTAHTFPATSRSQSIVSCRRRSRTWRGARRRRAWRWPSSAATGRSWRWSRTTGAGLPSTKGPATGAPSRRGWASSACGSASRSSTAA